MKKINYKHLFGGIVLIALILPLVTGISYADIFTFLGVGGGSLAFAAASGEVTKETSTKETTTTGSSELLTQAISEKITELKPSATPVDTILRKLAPSPKNTAWEYKYYQVDQRGFTDAAASAVASAALTAAEGATFDVVVGSDHIWNEDDTILFVGVTGYAGTGDFVAHVKTITDATDTLTCVCVNGLGTNKAAVPTIPQGTVLIRMGNAKQELDAQTDPYAIYPQPSTNYMQRFMAQAEESLFMFDANKEVKWNIADHRIQSMYDFRLSQELSILFGAKGYKKVGSYYYHHMDGITKVVTGTTTYTDGSMAKADLYTWSKAIFSGNSGSEKRYVFAGGDFMKQFSALEPVEKQMVATNTEMVFGITFNRIITNFGELMVMHHDLLNSVGWSKKALVLDLANIERPVWKPLKTTKLDLVKTGTRNANAYLLDETYTIATRYPATHKIIQPA